MSRIFSHIINLFLKNVMDLDENIDKIKPIPDMGDGDVFLSDDSFGADPEEEDPDDADLLDE